MNNLFKPILLSAIVLLDINNEGQCMEDAFIMNNAFIGEKIDPNKTNDISNHNNIFNNTNTNNTENGINNTQYLFAADNTIEKFDKIFEDKEMQLREACEYVDSELLKKYDALCNRISQTLTTIAARKTQYDLLNNDWKSNKDQWSIVQFIPIDVILDRVHDKESLELLGLEDNIGMDLNKFIKMVQNKLLQLYNLDDSSYCNYRKVCKILIQKVKHYTERIFKKISMPKIQKIEKSLSNDISELHNTCMQELDNLLHKLNMVNNNLVIIEGMDSISFMDEFLQSYLEDMNQLLIDLKESKISISNDKNSIGNYFNLEDRLKELNNKYETRKKQVVLIMCENQYYYDITKILYNTKNEDFLAKAQDFVKRFKSELKK